MILSTPESERELRLRVSEPEIAEEAFDSPEEVSAYIRDEVQAIIYEWKMVQ